MQKTDSHINYYQYNELLYWASKLHKQNVPKNRIFNVMTQ